MLTSVSNLLTGSEVVRETMESAMDLKVPLTVNVGVGDNWADAHG